MENSSTKNATSSTVERILAVESDPAFDEIEEKLDHPPVNWDPRGALKDDEKANRERRVIGTLEERESIVGFQNKSYELLTIRLRDGGRVWVRCWATVLRSKIEQKDPQPGDAIGIIYEGTKPNSDPQLADIELYDLVVRKADVVPESHRALAEELGAIKVADGVDALEPPPGYGEDDGDLPMSADA